MRKGSLIAAVAAAVTFALVAQVASAQYPSPRTTLICAVNQIEVQINSDAAVAATLRDAGGTPIAGQLVNFAVVSGDASLSADSASTDASGNAVVTVQFGATAGPVVIHASSDSAECQATSEIEAVAEVAGVSEVAPISEVRSIVPPTTGSAGLKGSGSGHSAIYAGLGGLALMLFGAVAMRTARVS